MCWYYLRGHTQFNLGNTVKGVTLLTDFRLITSLRKTILQLQFVIYTLVNWMTLAFWNSVFTAWVSYQISFHLQLGLM